MNDERREKERFDDLKEAYALGALSDNERSWFEGYLAAHPELQNEVDDLITTANLLALAPQEYEPSPVLRRNVLGRVDGPSHAGTAPGRERLRRLLVPAGLAAAAVLVAALVGLFAWNISLREDNRDLQSGLEISRTYGLQGSGAARDVRGSVVETRDGQAMLMAENLPPAPEGKTYEAWLFRGETPEPAGLFGPRGEETATMPIKGSLQSIDKVAVTVEPSGGSSKPTSDPLLTAPL